MKHVFFGGDDDSRSRRVPDTNKKLPNEPFGLMVDGFACVVDGAFDDSNVEALARKRRVDLVSDKMSDGYVIRVESPASCEVENRFPMDGVAQSDPFRTFVEGTAKIISYLCLFSNGCLLTR